MKDIYRGTIILESLESPGVLERFKILRKWETKEENPEDKWHLYSVNATEEDTDALKDVIKSGWYSHFWKENQVVVVFRGRVFEFKLDDKNTWAPAIEYGISQGIPREQLDFLIEN
ncbi:MAG: hypothetical protein AAB597_01355 [Patescibacteria group bacterium]